MTLYVSYAWKSMVSLSPGPSVLIRGARLICRFDFALPQELHSTVVIPFTRTPSACCTRCSIAAGPRCPSLLCQSMADAFCGALLVREVILRAWCEACDGGSYSSTHWPWISVRFPMIASSGPLRVVGPICVSHQIPLCLRSQKETRLHSRSGQIATSCKTSLVVPD